MIARGLIASAVAVAAMVAIALWTNGMLPDGDRIPVHYGLDGEPDRWGDRGEAMFALWFMIGITAFTALVLAAAPALTPRKENINVSERSYLMLWITVLVLMVGVTASISASMLGHDDISTRLMIGGMGALFAVIGNYLPKTRSNWVIGVRTPWTLSSETSWNATHRVTGRLYMISGALTVAAALFAPKSWLLTILLVSLIGSSLVGVVYSYFVWRGADDKIGEPDLIE
ncbi:MAG: SdpI family protein [Litorimonas sp.]